MVSVNSKKILLNTVFLYIRIIISIIISLWTVPIMLENLGVEDYGIYNLIAGIITMLSFLNVSMIVSTQRFMSVSLGKEDKSIISNVFNVGLVIHILLGLLIVCLLEISSLFVFDNFLNISLERIEASKILFQFLILNMFIVVMSVPFDAAINAHEDMMAFSIISIIEYLLKFILAFSLAYVNTDLLVFYGLGLLCVSILIFIIKFTYRYLRYSDIRINLRSKFDISLMKEMVQFTGYNVVSSFALVGSRQGVAVLYNLFFGAIANTAYGIANQVNGALTYFSTTLPNAMNPQIMKSEGSNDRKKVISMSLISSKFSTVILACFVVPLIMEMPYVLELWLKEVPLYTVELCRLILILSLFYQMSAGIMSSVQAVGNIKYYQITVSILYILILPITYFFLIYYKDIRVPLLVSIVLEIITLLVRIIFANKLVGINIKEFICKIVLPLLACILLSSIVPAFVVSICSPGIVRVIITTITFLSVFFTSIWYILLNSSDKNFAKNIFVMLKSKLIRR